MWKNITKILKKFLKFLHSYSWKHMPRGHFVSITQIWRFWVTIMTFFDERFLLVRHMKYYNIFERGLQNLRVFWFPPLRCHLAKSWRWFQVATYEWSIPPFPPRRGSSEGRCWRCISRPLVRRPKLQFSLHYSELPRSGCKGCSEDQMDVGCCSRTLCMNIKHQC